MHGHDADAVAPLFDNGRLGGLAVLGRFTQLVDEATERYASREVVLPRQFHDVQDIGEHLLPGSPQGKPHVRTRAVQQTAHGLGHGHVVAAAVQLSEKPQRLDDRDEVVGHDVRRPERAERLAVMVVVFEQLLVADGEEAAPQSGKHGQFVVRPFHGRERRPQRLDLLAIVKRPPPHQQMRHAARLEGIDVRPRDVGAPADEAPEQQTHVSGLDGYRLGAPTAPFGHRPSALVHEPVDEGPHRVGQRRLDRVACHVAQAVRVRHGQRHNRRLPHVVRPERRHRHVVGLQRMRVGHHRL